MKIYLAGHWRTMWREEMIKSINGAQWLVPVHPDDPGGTDPTNFVLRDLALIRRSDLLIALISSHARNIGTCTEVAYAYALGVPVVLIDLCAEDAGYAFQRKMATAVVSSLQEAINAVEFCTRDGTV